MEDFEKWLRTVCFQPPTPEAYDLAKDAWKHANSEEVMRLRGAMITAASILETDGDEHGVGAALRRATVPNA